jgi:hypothetical protein
MLSEMTKTIARPVTGGGNRRRRFHQDDAVVSLRKRTSWRERKNAMRLNESDYGSSDSEKSDIVPAGAAARESFATVTRENIFTAPATLKAQQSWKSDVIERLEKRDTDDWHRPRRRWTGDTRSSRDMEMGPL